MAQQVSGAAGLPEYLCSSEAARSDRTPDWRRRGSRAHCGFGASEVAAAECVGQFKGASSHSANESLGTPSSFRWESGYGALSLAERSLASVIAYVRNQR